MIKKPDYFVRKLKYAYPTRRNVKFEFQEKTYESKLGFNDRSNYQEFMQSFFNEKFKNKFNSDNFEILRENKYINKSNLLRETSLKQPFKIVPFELNRDRFLEENNYTPDVLNLGFTIGAKYEDEKQLYCNFFNYLKLKIDPRRYSVPLELVKEKEHIIKLSFNTSISSLLQQKFYLKMKEIPNSGYDKMGKFIVGIFDKVYYKQFTANMLSHMFDLNNKNKNTDNGSIGSSKSQNKGAFQVEIDYLLKGSFTPEYKADLLIRNSDDSFLLPITYGKHTNEIKNYKQLLEYFLSTPRPICTNDEKKNTTLIKPSLEERIAKLKKIKIGSYYIYL